MLPHLGIHLGNVIVPASIGATIGAIVLLFDSQAGLSLRSVVTSLSKRETFDPECCCQEKACCSSRVDA